MWWDCDSDSESDCDSEPASQSDSESELGPEPVTQPTPRCCSARLAALAPAAPIGPPLPLENRDLVIVRQLKGFCESFSNLNFKTVYSQLQRRLVREGQRRQPMLMPVFEDPSNQALLAKLQELGSINLRGDNIAPLTSERKSGQLVADQLARWKLTKGQVKHASGLHNSRCDTERWLAPTKPHLQHLAAASSAGTSLVANLKHITVTLATWDAVWEVYLDPKWARQRLRLYRAQDQALEQFFKELEEDMAGDTDQLRGRVVLVDEFQLATRELMGVAPRKPPQAPCSSQEATQPAASEPGPSIPPPAKRSKRTKDDQAAEPTQPTKGKGKAKGKVAKAKPAPQPGRLLDRDCNAALNMQRIGESRWRPLELCYWPEQGALPAKGKEYPGLGYKRLQDKPSKAQQQQQQQPAEAQ
ncbi:hypothetical protein QJQ45_012995 [Haematococcus lacustris]|nr:hypothetical protein QJQ45_012995 [Haematococcus lacustris]